MSKDFNDIVNRYPLTIDEKKKVLKYFYKIYPTWKDEKRCVESGAAEKLIQEYITREIFYSRYVQQKEILNENKIHI